MDKIAIIGGSNFATLKNLTITHSTSVNTPYGEPCGPLCYGIMGEKEVVFLPRRGVHQFIAPHQINYRANMWALRDAGVQTIIATAAVAGIHEGTELGDIVIPHQLIDYTYGRESSYFGKDSQFTHILFSHPYTEALRERLFLIAGQLRYPVIKEAIYAVMQGPRFETLAELAKLEKEGCGIVGMTGMPEAALARELDLDYACIALVVRKATAQHKNTDADFTLIEESKIRIYKIVEKLIQGE